MDTPSPYTCYKCNNSCSDCICVCSSCNNLLHLCQCLDTTDCPSCHKLWAECHCDDERDEGEEAEEPCHQCGRLIHVCECCKKCHEFHFAGDICIFDTPSIHNHFDDNSHFDEDDNIRCETCGQFIDGSEGWGTFCSRYCYQQSY